MMVISRPTIHNQLLPIRLGHWPSCHLKPSRSPLLLLGDASFAIENQSGERVGFYCDIIPAPTLPWI
jgi:hypothetical protein